MDKLDIKYVEEKFEYDMKKDNQYIMLCNKVIELEKLLLERMCTDLKRIFIDYDNARSRQETYEVNTALFRNFDTIKLR